MLILLRNLNTMRGLSKIQSSSSYYFKADPEADLLHDCDCNCCPLILYQNENHIFRGS